MSCEVELADFVFEHILEWEEARTRRVKKKSPIGKCSPTVESRHFSSTPRSIYITARVNSSEKEDLWTLFRECAWHTLYDKECELIDYVWMEQPSFKWDNSLGCGGRQWLANLGLVCSSS